jgi:PAS domain S-box-containing protein
MLFKITRSFGLRQTMLLTAGCFVLIALGVTGVTLVSRNYSRQGTRQTETLTGEFLPGLVTLARLQDAALNLKSLTYQFALAGDDAAMKEQKQAFQDTTVQVIRNVAQLKLLAHDEPTQRLIAAFAVDLQSYREGAEKFQAELGASEFEKAMATLDQQVAPAQQEIEKQLDALNEQYFGLAADAGTRTTAVLVQSDHFGLLATVVLAGFTLLCLVLSLAATRALVAQVERQDAERQIAQDTLEKRVVERTEELATSLSVLNATLDSTTDGILAVRLSGEVLCHNSKFALMWRVPTEVIDTRSSLAVRTFLASQMQNPEQYIRRIEEQRRTPEVDTFDVLELADGRIFERYAKAQQIGAKIVGVVISFRDVTKRKSGEAELENAYKRLLETSRQAGMAEVATSVLHNVGNVLNSVNISCSVVADKVRRSRITGVAKTADLLRQHTGDLAAFFTSDPTGQKLPDFLGKLAARLSDEQAEVLQELQLLCQNIEHIKDIVAMQQNYAKISGVTETVKVTDLVEDSLRMNDGALLRHEVQVVRDYAEVPPITVEKHKVLQVLVNLIRNAKYACDESGRADKQLTVRVSIGDDRVRIAIVDNGVGIPAENLTRIFSHGFTTRQDGHGFGLHSGVLAAQEMGGRLTAHSDGPGTGATFILELPLSPSGNK